MPRDIVPFCETFCVVEYAGQGLKVFPANRFASLQAALEKQLNAPQPPRLSRMTRPEIDALLAAQRSELAEEPARRPDLPCHGYQLSKKRRAPTSAVHSERRIKLLGVVAEAPDVLSMLDLKDLLGTKGCTIRSQLIALEETGLVTLSRTKRIGTGGQPPIHARVTQKGRNHLAGLF